MKNKTSIQGHVLQLDHFVAGSYLTILSYIILMAILFFLKLRVYLATLAIKPVELESQYAQRIYIDFHLTVYMQRDTEVRQDIRQSHNEAMIEYHDFTFINFYAFIVIDLRHRFAPSIEAETKTMTFRDENKNAIVAKLLRINGVSFHDVCERIGIRAYPTVKMYKRDGTFVFYGDERKTQPIVNLFVTVESEAIQFVSGANELIAHHSAIEKGCVNVEFKVRRVS